MDALSTFYNNMIDVVGACMDRLLEWPLFLLFPIAIGAWGGMLLGAWLIGKAFKRPWPSARFARTLGLCWAFFALLFAIDKKFGMILTELRGLRGLKGMIIETMRRPAGREANAAAPAGRRLLFDEDKARAALEEAFKGVEMTANVDSKAVDHIAISLRAPRESRMHLAVIDLTTPGLEIVLTKSMGPKILTTDFARENDCTIAINGEAGESPAPESGLGQWKGNWIVEGNPVMLEDTDIRPFLSFDKTNRARYFPAKLVDKTNDPEKWNTIWGRFDLLLDGKNVGNDKHDGPRTCMGISKAGDRLILLVADGRQPGYSLGVGLDDAATIMRIFGAEDAMSCDQGGSSCMYLKRVEGIVNVPSDPIGERPTYSHFGIRLKN